MMQQLFQQQQDMDRFMEESIRNHQMMVDLLNNQSAAETPVDPNPEFMKEFNRINSYVERLRMEIQEEKKRQEEEAERRHQEFLKGVDERKQSFEKLSFDISNESFEEWKEKCDEWFRTSSQKMREL